MFGEESNFGDVGGVRVWGSVGLWWGGCGVLWGSTLHHHSFCQKCRNFVGEFFLHPRFLFLPWMAIWAGFTSVEGALYLGGKANYRSLILGGVIFQLHITFAASLYIHIYTYTCIHVYIIVQCLYVHMAETFEPFAWMPATTTPKPPHATASPTTWRRSSRRWTVTGTAG